METQKQQIPLQIMIELKNIADDFNARLISWTDAVRMATDSCRGDNDVLYQFINALSKNVQAQEPEEQ